MAAVGLIGMGLAANLAVAERPDANWRDEFRETGQIASLAEQRMQFVYTRYYRPWDERERQRRNKVVEYFNQDKCDNAISQAGKLIEVNPFSLTANFILAACLDKFGRQDDAAFHRYVARRLMEILEESGTGDSPIDSIKVISISEIYDYLDMRGYRHFDYRPDLGDPNRVAIEARSEADTTLRRFYFDVEIVSNHRMRARN